MKYYSRAEAASLLGVTKWTLKRLIRDNMLTETRDGIPSWSLESLEAETF